MVNTRANCPRIVEIEAEIQKLTTELCALVQPTKEENEMTSEGLRDVYDEVFDDLYFTQDALDQR